MTNDLTIEYSNYGPTDRPTYGVFPHLSKDDRQSGESCRHHLLNLIEMIYTKAESFYDQHSRWQDTDGKQSGDGSVSASTEDSHLLYGNRPTSNTDNDLLRLESSYFRVYEELADSQSLAPSIDPTPRPTRVPSALKSRKPTNMPSERPTRNPTIKPSFTPTQLFLASTNIIVSQYLVSLSPAESFYSDESATSSFISCVNQIIPPNGTVSILNISDISDLSSSGQILLTDQTNRQLSQTMYNIDISYNVAYFLYDSSDLSSMSQEIKQNVTADLTSSVNDGSFLYLLHNTSSSALRNISSLGEPVISSGDINYVYTLLPTIAPSSRPSSFHPTRRPSVMASFSPTMYSTTILEDTYIITLCAVGFGIGLIIVGKLCN